MSQRAEITVFLTLILWVLLSFIGVMLQSVFYSALQSYSKLNLQMAVNAVGTKYVAPLWEDYHLFMLEGCEDDEGTIKEEVESYFGEKSGSMYQIREKDVNVQQVVPLLEDGGRFYLYEIKEYMKYHMADDLFEQSDNNKILEASGPTKVLLDQKQETEQNIAVLDSLMLELMQCIEGIRIQGGKLKPSSHFVKMLCPQEPSPVSVGISRKEVWEALDDCYISPEEMTPKIAGKIVGDIKSAEQILERMEEKQRTLTEEVDQFIEQYRKTENNIMKEAKANILHDIGRMKEHVGAGKEKNMYHVQAMKKILEKNKEILKEYQENPSENRNLLKYYQIQGLYFDYSGLILKKQADNPCAIVEKAVGKSLLNLLLEHPENLADGGWNGDPYYLSNEPSRMSAFEKEAYLSWEIAYLFEHFTHYEKEIEGKSENGRKYQQSDKPQAGRYEIEYLIDGKNKDREALAGVAERIVASRTAINFVYLLSDTGKCAQAYEAAAAIVGFTGMAALIEATKTAILAVWAAAEAMVDTALLLRGEKVALLKNQTSFLLEFHDLFRFGKSLIQQKCTSYQKRDGNGLTNYEIYLKAFLLAENAVQRRNRSLHIIEENMRCRYEKDFAINRAIYSFRVKGNFLYCGGQTSEVTASYAY